MDGNLVQGGLTQEQQQSILETVADINAQLSLMVLLNSVDQRTMPAAGEAGSAFVVSISRENFPGISVDSFQLVGQVSMPDRPFCLA
jgi:hypothetical protein